MASATGTGAAAAEPILDKWVAAMEPGAQESKVSTAMLIVTLDKLLHENKN